MKNRMMNYLASGLPSFLLCSWCVLLISTSDSAQNQRPVEIPREMIQLLDVETRECIKANGGISEGLKAERVYLNRDRTPEILVQASTTCLCGANNCPYWIFRRVGSEYKLILTLEAVANVIPKNTYTNGYRDITVEGHSSAFETNVWTYTFNGQQYQIKDCFIRNYLDNKGRRMKRPTFRKCE